MADEQLNMFEDFADEVLRIVNKSQATTRISPELKVANKQFNLNEQIRDLADEILQSNRVFLEFLTAFKSYLNTRGQCTNLIEKQHKIITKFLRSSERKAERTTAKNETINVVSGIDTSNSNVILIGGILSAIHNIYAYFFEHKLSKNDLRVQILEIRETLEKDNSLVCDVFECGYICKSQFIHTRESCKKFLKAIRESNLKMENFEYGKNTFEFLSILSEFSSHCIDYPCSNVKCFFKQLIQRTNGNESGQGDISNSEKKCSNVSAWTPHAIEVFDYLSWKFDTQNFDFDERKTLYRKLKTILKKGDRFDVERYLDLIEEYILRLKEENRILNSAVMKLVENRGTTLLYEQLIEDIVGEMSQF